MRLGVRILLAVCILGMLAGMVWAGGIYSWHFKVERIIRYMEDNPEQAALPQEMENALYQAGCRALPNLVRASRPEVRASLQAFSTHYAVELINREPATTTKDCDRRAQRRKEMVVQPDDPEGLRKEKVDRLRQWWADHGGEVHQWWRFWTGNCRGDN